MLVLLRRPAPSNLRSLRLFHSSLRASDYVAPPDPVSNIRQVLYDDPTSTNVDSAAPLVRHPYSLDEFRDDADTLEYQWKLHRQQLDAFNDTFWRDTNTRFEAAKDAAISSLPPHPTAEQREERLSEFYKNWVLQEARRQEEYNSEWRRRSMQEIKLAARVPTTD